MIDIWIIIGLILTSGVKLLFTPIAMIFKLGYSFWTTIIVTSAGGVLGVVVFYFFGKAIIKLLKSKKPKKKFTKQNRWIVRTKNRFGLIGIAATMGIVSVPLATILVAKYFGHEKKALPVLVFTAISWSFAVTTISFLIKLLF